MVNFDITKKLADLEVVTEETFDRLEEYFTSNEWMDIFKEKLMEAMKQNGIKKWETTYYTFTLIDDGMTSRIDIEPMKEQSVYIVDEESGELEGINAYEYYQRFRKQSPRKGYIKVTKND